MSISNSSNLPSRLESDLLRTFLAVAECGSFSQAADRIHRSQSAVSLQIKQLETSVGGALFHRHARGVELTTTGEKLCLVAEKVVSLLDETIVDLRAAPLSGSLRIGIPDEYGVSLLPGVIARFAREHPLVELSVRCSFSADFPQALARGEIDLAVHAVESLNHNMRELSREKTHWVSSKTHATQSQDPLPVALFDRACWWRDMALSSLERSGRKYRVVFSSESVTGINAAISAGVAVGVVSDSSLQRDFQILGETDGFPGLPDSTLVLERGDSGEAEIVDAMARAIGAAFNRG